MNSPDLKQRGTIVLLAANGREVPKLSGPLWELLNALDLPFPDLQGRQAIRLDGQDDLITGEELKRLLTDDARNQHPRTR